MKAMVLKRLSRLEENPAPLEFETLPDPIPQEHEILIKISACAVCHTELDEIEGRTAPPRFPIILGHQVVGRVIQTGPGVRACKLGDRVGVAWIFSACGRCKFCLRGQENLCPDFQATGRDAHGGYAQYMTVREDFAYPIPEIFSDVEAAPLLCAGAIGYRSLRLANVQDGDTVGLTGFGASGHLVLQLARALSPHTKIFVFARSETERAFAKELGAVWAGDIGEEAPEKLDAIIDTTPVWRPIVASLKNLERGGRLVINAIRKEDSDKSALLELDYATHLWLEKEIKTVANVTRRDVREFLEIAAKIPIKPDVQIYKLAEANQALLDLKARTIRGAKVLQIE